jgi:hypothetical protein
MKKVEEWILNFFLPQIVMIVWEVKYANPGLNIA